jgi:hypothetical protein
MTSVIPAALLCFILPALGLLVMLSTIPTFDGFLGKLTAILERMPF